MAALTMAPTLDTLRARWRAAMTRVTSGRPVLVSVSLALPAIDPLNLFARTAATAPERFYWERPADDVAFVGIGAAWAVESASHTVAGRGWRALLETAVIDATAEGAGRDTTDSMAGPLLVGGFAFDPARPATTLWEGYPDGRLVLPRLTLITRGATSIVTLNAIVSSGDGEDMERMIRAAEDLLAHGSDPRAASAPARHGDLCVDDVIPRAAWEALVADGARACRDGALRKVVLARAARVRSRESLDTVAALRYARDAYPNAYTFAVAHGAGAFIGATPERLARLHDGMADVSCLAGSSARGATPEEDRARGAALLVSVKDRAEHTVVVDAVRDVLASACPDLRVPSAPRLLRLPNVQHLYTPVTGRVAAGTDVLDLVARLHPTPAVGGQPRAPALAYIRTREGLDRGWYAAPVGWLDRHGEGEFVVALRSALVRGDEATLFAGCGIVADSCPAAEYDETRLKLRPMLAALGAR